MVYPPTLPPARTDSTLSATNHAGDHNALRTAVMDLIAVMGADPSGSFGDLTTRLEDGLDAALRKPTGANIGSWALLRTDDVDPDELVWATSQEVVARALGWIIATDATYAGGVDPTGVEDSSDAIDAIALAVAGRPLDGSQPAYPIALRDSVAPIWLPAGTIKCTRRHEFVSMKSLTIGGGGPRGTTISFVGVTTVGTGVAPAGDPSLGDALSFVSCPGLSLSDFRVYIDVTSTINGSALGIDCMPVTGGVGYPKGNTTGSRMRMARVYVEGQGKWINGIAVGRCSNTFDLANFYGYNLSVSGPTAGKPAPLTYDATYWQNGILFGSGGAGNLLNYEINTCTVDFHKNAYVTDTVDNVSFINCNSSHNGVYLTVFGRTNTKASAFRCESTERLLVRGPTVSAPGKVTLEDYSFGDNSTAAVMTATGAAVNIVTGGNLVLNLGGADIPVALTSGDTPASVVTKINTAIGSAGLASLSGSNLRITSTAVGSPGKVQVVSGTGTVLANLSLTVSTVNGVGDFATDRQVIRWTGGGTLILRQSTWDATSYGDAYKFKIFGSTNTTQQLNVLIDGITLPNNTMASVFEDLATTYRVYAKWRGRTQYGTGGSSLTNHDGGGSYSNAGAVGDLDVITVPSSAQTGTAYTAKASDAGKVITMTNAAANVVTIPPDTFPLYAILGVEQLGAGNTSLAPGAGVTIRSRGALTALAGQYAAASLRQITANEWLLTGDLA